VAGVADTRAPPAAQIEIRVDDVSQLFDNLDPFPFRERDLDKDAEEYIVGWARELPYDAPIAVVVHVKADSAGAGNVTDIGDALRRYFAYRADMASRDLSELFRIGRVAIVIGLSVLVVCIGASGMITMRFGDDRWGQIVQEGLIIVGWVANWRPIEIFLYDWWPIVRRRRLYRRLASATVEVRRDG
jgi:hypothetical protein